MMVAGIDKRRGSDSVMGSVAQRADSAFTAFITVVATSPTNPRVSSAAKQGVIHYAAVAWWHGVDEDEVFNEKGPLISRAIGDISSGGMPHQNRWLR